MLVTSPNWYDSGELSGSRNTLEKISDFPKWVISSGGTWGEMLMAKKRRRNPKYTRRTTAGQFRYEERVNLLAKVKGNPFEPSTAICSSAEDLFNNRASFQAFIAQNRSNSVGTINTQ
jgi:hypothetical protein